MFYTYILKSTKNNKYYIGYTKDLKKRIEKHNKGSSSWTKKHKPWKIVYTERFQTKSEAIKRENKIKSYKGGTAFKILISRDGGVDNRNSL